MMMIYYKREAKSENVMKMGTVPDDAVYLNLDEQDVIYISSVSYEDWVPFERRVHDQDSIAAEQTTEQVDITVVVEEVSKL